MTAPLIEVLPASQGEQILARNRVGRIAFTNQGRVNILPIHYRYDDGWIYGRTQPGGKLLLILRNRRVAFCSSDRYQCDELLATSRCTQIIRSE